MEHPQEKTLRLLKRTTSFHECERLVINRILEVESKLSLGDEDELAYEIGYVMRAVLDPLGWTIDEYFEEDQTK